MVVILATLGTSWQAGTAQRAGIAGHAAAVLTVTVATAGLRYMVAGHVLAVPTMDLLAKVFDLQGEDIDDAFLYEVWLEIWLACAAVFLVARRLRRAVWQPRPTDAARPGPWDQPSPPPLPAPRWNAATILLFLIGLGALGGAVAEGHWTAAFLAGSVHVTGTIADPLPHPIIRFTAQDGTVVQFQQNGSVSRPLGADVPVSYQPDNPAGTAQADTIWANWSNVLGMLWIGLGFTLAPFFGFRAVFRPVDGRLRVGRPDDRRPGDGRPRDRPGMDRRLGRAGLPAAVAVVVCGRGLDRHPGVRPARLRPVGRHAATLRHGAAAARPADLDGPPAPALARTVRAGVVGRLDRPVGRAARADRGADARPGMGGHPAAGHGSWPVLASAAV